MRKFIVPQFIDVESKIFGPITVRQFGTIAVAAIFIFVAYRLADFALFLIWLVIIVLLAVVIGFVKINGQPFHIFIINFIGSLKKPAVRVWHKSQEVESKAQKENKKNKKKGDDYVYVPKQSLETSKLSELALIIDTGGIYKGEAEANRINKSLYQNG